MLESKLESLASLIGQIGLGAGLLAFTALATQFSWQHFAVEGQSWDWSLAPIYLRYLIISITILVSPQCMLWHSHLQKGAGHSKDCCNKANISMVLRCRLRQYTWASEAHDEADLLLYSLSQLLRFPQGTWNAAHAAMSLFTLAASSAFAAGNQQQLQLLKQFTRLLAFQMKCAVKHHATQKRLSPGTALSTSSCPSCNWRLFV